MTRPQFARILQRLYQGKLSQDIAYSLVSFAVLAMSGIVINIVIASLRDADALGTFNIAYAVYIVGSQLAVWGLHYSVLRHSAFYESDPVERGHLLLTAGACALAMGVLTASVVALAEPLFALIFSNETTGKAIRNAALGLVLFPLNKVLMAYLNGLRRMKAFAVMQAVRYLTVMLLVSVIAVSSQPIEIATLCFFLAELITLLLTSVYIANSKLAGELRFCRTWIQRHFAFGTKSLLVGIFYEVNSRIDVLMVGFFLSERATGIYSFAAMLADGVYNLLTVVRINFSPVLVNALRDKEWLTAQNLRQQSRRFVLPATLALSLVLILAFCVFTVWVMPPSKGLLEGLPSLVILLTALVMVSFLVPFDQLLMMSGHPVCQTAQQLVMVGTNIIVAMLLIPSWGIEGAAAGTAASYVAGVLILTYFASRLFGWNLVTNHVRMV